MFDQQMQQETQLRQSSPKKGRASTAKKVNKRTTSVTTTITSGPISTVYVQRGITETNVELDHLRTLNTEVERERRVTVSV